MYCLITMVIFYIILCLSSRFFPKSEIENGIICESPSRQTCMSDLTEELFIEVLLRLPVKSLLRFKVACKAWRSHISDRKFVKRHVMRAMTNPSNDYFIAHNKSHSDYDRLCAVNVISPRRAISLELPIASSVSGDNFDIVGSCNGLLCLDYKRSFQRRDKESRTKKLYLWNPATRKVKELPSYNINIENSDDNNCVSLGFGFDIASSDYKVVRIVREKDSLANRVEVYSLNNNSWNEIKGELKFRVYQDTCPAFVNGIIYWDVKPAELLLFNVQSEDFCTISLPPGTRCYDLFEFKGSVAFTRHIYSPDKIIDIWTRHDDISWIKKFTIRNSLIMNTNSIFSSVDSNLVGYLKTGEFVGRIFSDEIFLYDPVSEAIKPSQLKMHTLKTYNYNESLVYLS